MIGIEVDETLHDIAPGEDAGSLGDTFGAVEQLHELGIIGIGERCNLLTLGIDELQPIVFREAKRAELLLPSRFELVPVGWLLFRPRKTLGWDTPQQRFDTLKIQAV